MAPSILHSEEDYLLLSYVVDSNIEITKELKDGGWDHLILTNPQWIDRFGDPSKLKPVEYGSLANSMQEFLDVQMPILTAMEMYCLMEWDYINMMERHYWHFRCMWRWAQQSR